MKTSAKLSDRALSRLNPWWTKITLKRLWHSFLVPLGLLIGFVHATWDGANALFLGGHLTLGFGLYSRMILLWLLALVGLIYWVEVYFQDNSSTKLSTPQGLT